LIAEFAPKGVEFTTLGDIGRWYGGGTPSKSKPEYWLNGTIPWVSPKDMGRRVVDSAIDTITEAAVSGSATKLVPPISVAMVVRSSILDHTFPTALVPVAVALNQDMKAVVPKEGVIPAYLAHLLNSRGQDILRVARKTGGSVASIETSKLFGFRIPVPPLEVQREIVRVLDQFTQLEAELEAELEARRRQYEHYRDQLLTFREAGGVRWIPMGEFGSIFGGLTGKSKADFVEGNARFVAYTNVFNNLAVDLYRDDRVRIGSGERQRALALGDILFTGSSESAGEVAMSSVVTSEPEEPTYLNSFSIGFRPNDVELLDPAFSKHLFRSSELRRQLVATASGVTRFNVSKSRLAKVLVPIPTLDRQRSIAAALDNFEALVNDLSIGLPAELAARRKQYEYYRDRLLTFEEVAA
jgi:type I restriction enzyme S subunit